MFPEVEMIKRISKNRLLAGDGDKRALFLLVGFSLALKGVLLFFTEVITPDGTLYVNQAQLILDGELKRAMALHGNMFFYPLLMAGFSFLGPDLILSGQILSLLFSVFTLVPLYFVVKGVFDEKIAFWTGLLFIVIPGLNVFSIKVMRDPGFVFAFWWVVYFAWKAVSFHKKRFYLGVWFFSALAFLFRIEGFLLPLAFASSLLILALSIRAERAQLLKGLIFFLGPCLVLALGLYFFYGDKALSLNRFGDFWRYIKAYVGSGLFDYLPQVKAGLKNLEATLPGGATDNDFGEITSKNLRFFYFVSLLIVLAKVMYLPNFLILSLGFRNRFNHNRGHFLFAALFLTYLSMAFVFLLHRNFVEDRFVYLPILMMLPFVGNALNTLWGWTKRQRMSFLWIFAGVTLFFVLPVFNQVKELKKQEVSVRQAGEWLKNNREMAGLKMVANDRRIPLYAGRGLDYLSFNPKGETGFQRMEDYANTVEAQLLSIEMRVRRVDSLPEFKNFHLVAKFMDNTNAGLIFRRN